MRLKALGLAAMAFGALLALASPVGAQNALEKTDIKLAVGGKTLFYYLPLTLAERLGYFKDEGLNVEITDFGGGSKALQALVGGSSDVTTGAFDHTIQMQAKSQPLVAVVELGRYPGIVLALTKAKAAAYKGPQDLKGMKIGVTAPGSSTNFMVNYILARNGMVPEDVSFIGIGSGAQAVAAIKRGELDGLSHLDPVMSQLETAGDVSPIFDTRSEEGSRAVYGGAYPAAVLYMTPDFLKKNPNTSQALVNAFVRTLVWLRTATPDQIAAAVPPEYLAGDKTLYMTAFERSRKTYSTDGRFSSEGAQNAFKVLTAFDPTVRAAGDKIDLKSVSTNALTDKALQKYGK